VPDTFSKAVERAMNVRDTTVLLRLSDESSDKVDTLVSAGVFRSRGEAAAFLVEEGIKAQSALFQRIQDKLTEIEKLRDELRTSISPEPPK
jgi:Arc/MetJ-type ribon-helix-helix transcriptional regulator